MLTLPFIPARACARPSGMNTFGALLPALAIPITLKLVLATVTVEPTFSLCWWA